MTTSVALTLRTSAATAAAVPAAVAGGVLASASPKLALAVVASALVVVRLPYRPRSSTICPSGAGSARRG